MGADRLCCGLDAPARPPLTPKSFAEKLNTLTFTNGADQVVVAGLYAKTVRAALGAARRLDFADLGWGGDQLRQLSESLLLANNLEELQLRFNPCGDEGAIAIASALIAGGLPSLRVLGWRMLASVTRAARARGGGRSRAL